LGFSQGVLSDAPEVRPSPFRDSGLNKKSKKNQKKSKKIKKKSKKIKKNQKKIKNILKKA